MSAMVAKPDMNPEDVPVTEIAPKIFLCQRTLERCSPNQPLITTRTIHEKYHQDKIIICKAMDQ